MHLQTHILSGWCLGNCFRLTPRQRLFCMLAAALPDLDGLGILAGERFFADWHHVLGHNVFFLLALSIALAAFSPSPLKTLPLYLALAHLHLLADYFGSGAGWRIHYLWPLLDTGWRAPHPWKFYSWQNLLAAAAMLLWTLAIVLIHGRTPLERLMPSLDAQLVALLRYRAGRPATPRPLDP